MWSIPDPRRRWAVVLALTCGGGLLLMVLTGWWAFQSRPSITLPLARIIVADATPATQPLDPTRWQVSLWRPFVDQPVGAAVNVAPITVKLFSVLHRNGVLTAAFDTGPGNPLLYAKAGETVGSIQVLAVDAAGVDVVVNGVKQHVVVTP